MLSPLMCYECTPNASVRSCAEVTLPYACPAAAVPAWRMCSRRGMKRLRSSTCTTKRQQSAACCSANAAACLCLSAAQVHCSRVLLSTSFPAVGSFRIMLQLQSAGFARTLNIRLQRDSQWRGARRCAAVHPAGEPSSSCPPVCCRTTRGGA